MKRNPHDKILREKPKKQHLNTVSNSYPIYIYIYVCMCVGEYIFTIIKIGSITCLIVCHISLSKYFQKLIIMIKMTHSKCFQRFKKLVNHYDQNDSQQMLSKIQTALKKERKRTDVYNCT